MTFQFRCSAGHQVTAFKNQAGATVWCAQCGCAVTVPEVLDPANGPPPLPGAGESVLPALPVSSPSAAVGSEGPPPLPVHKPGQTSTDGPTTLPSAIEPTTTLPVAPIQRTASPGLPLAMPVESNVSPPEAVPISIPTAVAIDTETTEAASGDADTPMAVAIDGEKPSTVSVDSSTPSAVAIDSEIGDSEIGDSQTLAVSSRPRRAVCIHVPDPSWTSSLWYLAGVLGGLVVFSAVPALRHADLAAGPIWARAVLLIAALQLVYLAWMGVTPDWSSVLVVMVVFAVVALGYAVAIVLVLVTGDGAPLPLEIEAARNTSALWCATVLVLSLLGVYLTGRFSFRWRGTLDRQSTGSISLEDFAQRPG